MTAVVMLVMMIVVMWSESPAACSWIPPRGRIIWMFLGAAPCCSGSTLPATSPPATDTSTSRTRRSALPSSLSAWACFPMGVRWPPALECSAVRLARVLVQSFSTTQALVLARFVDTDAALICTVGCIFYTLFGAICRTHGSNCETTGRCVA